MRKCHNQNQNMPLEWETLNGGESTQYEEHGSIMVEFQTMVFV